MAKRINDEIVSEEIKKVKSETEIIDNSDKFIDAQAEKYVLLFEKTFNEHHEKKLKEENTENNTNLDYEDGLVNDVLTKITKRIGERIQSDQISSKTTKFLKVIDSFFHSIFDSK